MARAASMLLLFCALAAVRAGAASSSRSLTVHRSADACVSTTDELVQALAPSNIVDGVIDVKLCHGCVEQQCFCGFTR